MSKSPGPSVSFCCHCARWLGDETENAAAVAVAGTCAASTRTTLPLDAPGSGGEEESLSLADRLGDEDPGYEQAECLAVLEDAFRSLDQLERTVLCLHFADDLTQLEIASRLGVSRAQVARHLRSGISRLRSTVSADGERDVTLSRAA